jgi:dipeptidyl aminopeptidase/acylaminoacyl peptidase
MESTSTTPFGAWRSPITATLATSGSLQFFGIVIEGADIYWVEQRPAEGGRNVVVRLTDGGKPADVTLPPYNVRTRVHEYGGGAFTVSDGIVFFSNLADSGIYRQRPGEEAVPVCVESGMRYADFIHDRLRNRLIAVREDHTAGDAEPANTIVAIDLESGTNMALISGADFYSSPRLDPDGSRLAWISWNHPNMPWDGTGLYVAALDDAGMPRESRLVAGGPDESVLQPEWSSAGELFFITDPDGWWNLYRDGVEGPRAVLPMEAEFGRPHWGFGMSQYGFRDDRTVIAAFCETGVWSIGQIDIESGTMQRIPLPFPEIERYLRVTADFMVFVAGSPVEPLSIMRYDFADGRLTLLRRGSSVEIDHGYLSVRESIEFPTENGLTAFAFYYPPANRDHAGPSGDLPPLLVKCHGGPTSAAVGALVLGIQFWTSRGFAVLDVNYGGSTGYGRAYRGRLAGNWGVVDVDDCVNAALHLVRSGKADAARLAIDGGSAGGFTVLSALTFRDLFRAGASYYGVSDLELLHAETHKFESRYDLRLIGPYPERRDLFIARSPIHFVEQLSAPVIFFQGMEDKVVPPDQAERMVEAMRSRGVPVAYIPFEGEGHGFRRSENVIRSLEAELYFYGRVFGFDPADEIVPVPIDNLDDPAAA